MTAEKYDVLKRAVGSRSNKSTKCTFREELQLLSMPLMGSADTSVANYVWFLVEWEDNVPHIRWRDAWNLEELV